MEPTKDELDRVIRRVFGVGDALRAIALLSTLLLLVMKLVNPDAVASWWGVFLPILVGLPLAWIGPPVFVIVWVKRMHSKAAP